MKIKVNLSKETVSIKGLTPLEFSVIENLLSHVRLGQGAYDGGASDVAFDFAEALEGAALDLDALDMPEVTVSAVPSEEVDGVCIVIDGPTLEVFAD